jgi:hypothetical protein
MNVHGLRLEQWRARITGSSTHPLNVFIWVELLAPPVEEPSPGKNASGLMFYGLCIGPVS